ncbi:hypothetical protein [Haloarchaeobius sp. DT45]|uniref:hypothetical protein n=1 Tax=Haloarchaeobius sp. DT45 TaxID=3446116 RepID=UPI003F6B0655
MSVQDVEQVVGAWASVDCQPMFGLPSFTVDGRLFAVVDDDRLALTKLTTSEREALASLVPVEPFVTDGLSVAAWAVVSVADLGVVEPYLRTSYENARRR